MKYVHNGTIINSLPENFKLSNGSAVSGFKHWEQSDPGALIAEGFLPVTIVNNETYDPEIQTRTGPTITENVDHAVLDYVVTDKPLLEVQTDKKTKVKFEGRQILKQKWDLEYRIMNMYTPTEITQMDADKDTLYNYYKATIEPLIDSATTVQEVKSITYTWPTI